MRFVVPERSRASSAFDGKRGEGVGTVLGDLLSPLHIALLLIVALLIFGPRRLPELGSAVGKTIKEFQRSMNEARASMQTTAAIDEGKPTAASTVAGSVGEAGKPN